MSSNKIHMWCHQKNSYVMSSNKIHMWCHQIKFIMWMWCYKYLKKTKTFTLFISQNIFENIHFEVQSKEYCFTKFAVVNDFVKKVNNILIYAIVK